MEKQRSWVWDFLYLCYFCYLIYYLFKDVPIQAKVWYYLARDWQRLARFWGEAGLQAEAEYHRAIRKVSLA